MPSNLHQTRRQQFYQHLNDGEALILFAGSAPRKSADAAYRFFANRNFFYLTGIVQAESVFLAVKTGEEIVETLFIHKKDPMAERWNGYRISPEEASECSGVEQVKELDEFEGALKEAIEIGGVSALWYDFDKYDAGRADAPQIRHSAASQSAYPFVSLKNAYPAICAARTIKDETEIAHIREAMTITRDGIHEMMKSAKAGMHEYQLEAVFNKVLADAGVRESAFANIVSGGRNNFYIHYEEPTGMLNDGDLILTDVGARKNEYVTDISRAFPVNGKFTSEQKEVYSIALQVNKELMGLLVPARSPLQILKPTPANASARNWSPPVSSGRMRTSANITGTTAPITSAWTSTMSAQKAIPSSPGWRSRSMSAFTSKTKTSASASRTMS